MPDGYKFKALITSRAGVVRQNRLEAGRPVLNALLPEVIKMGRVFSFSLGANVRLEKVFAWPGIGSCAVKAPVASDCALGHALVWHRQSGARRVQPGDCGHAA